MKVEDLVKIISSDVCLTYITNHNNGCVTYKDCKYKEVVSIIPRNNDEMDIYFENDNESEAN